MTRVDVNPALLKWARERAGMTTLELDGKFPDLERWEDRSIRPTLKQLEVFARTVHAPLGYLFLPSPPEEPSPIPDFRTVADRHMRRPSVNLLDTIYLCQQRQEWYRDHVLVNALGPAAIVGTSSTADDPCAVARTLSKTLGASIDDRQSATTWNEALRDLVGKIESAGILVMASSIVGSNSHRHLHVAEFRGFALADEFAPLIFINAADSKSAQMFTLAHEIAHLALGASGISDPEVGAVATHETERWCNRVAAEFLVPIDALEAAFSEVAELSAELPRLARLFKVSTLVVLRRLFEAGHLDRTALRHAYEQELKRLDSLEPKRSGGGDFYRTLGVRTGKRFAEAVIASSLEGQTLFRDGLRLLGMKKMSTFHEAARFFGVQR